jgi:DNA-binding CsgD family transcriptional regulator
MVFSVKDAGETRIGLALNRCQGDFSERDRGVLAFLSPHITQAFQNARIAGEMAINLERIGEGLGTINRAVILTEASGRIRWLSPLAREWLEKFFADYTPSSPSLPSPLKSRLVQAAASGAGARQTFCELELFVNPGERITAYYGKANDGVFVIALARERTRIDPAAASSFGLTPREAEMLFWISEGKANQDIGVALGISHRTVHKHVEHLFAKLGVNNRSEAQRMGWELRRL